MRTVSLTKLAVALVLPFTAALGGCGGSSDGDSAAPSSTAGAAGSAGSGGGTSAGHGGNGVAGGSGASGKGGASHAGASGQGGASEAGSAGQSGASGSAGHGGASEGGKGGTGGSSGGVGGATSGSGGASGGAGAGGTLGEGGAVNAGGAGTGGNGGATSGGAAGTGGTSGAAGGAIAAAVLAYPVTCPGPGFTAGAAMAPVVLDGMSDVVLDGVSVTNPSGPCISITNGSSHITIRNSVVGPCMGNGIEVDNSSDVTVENNWISNTTGPGVYSYQATNLTVDGNCMDTIQTGVEAANSMTVVVEHNAIKDVQGPFPRGQLTQFDNVNGPGSRVRCNVGDDVQGQSNPEDAINMYQSNGTSDSPILIEGNRIRGGGPSTSGGGILLGDGGKSSWQISRANVLVNPGQYGIAVGSGTNMTMEHNLVYAAEAPWTNVGAYVWNQYDSACGPVLVTKNQVDFTNKDGENNPWFDGSQSPSDPSYPVCSNTTIATDNVWNATLNVNIVDAVPAVCP